jgi:hypothetical protein
MKGIIFNLLEDFAVETLGEDRYHEILSECSLKTQEPFVAPGTYPDEDLLLIVGKTVEKSKIPLPDLLRTFGRWCFPKLGSRYPIFLTAHTHPKPFLKTVDSVIHVEVKKLYRDAETPQFRYRDPAPDRLIIEYISRRKLCKLMEGLLEGVGDYFKSPVQYRQTRCALEMGDVCEFDVSF